MTQTVTSPSGSADPDITDVLPAVSPEPPTWTYVETEPGQPPTAQQMADVFAGRIAGVVCRRFFDADKCGAIMDRIRVARLAEYAGMTDALTSLGPTHWEVGYVHGDWELYFDRVGRESAQLAELTAPIGDVRAIVNRALEPAIGPIRAVRCPRTGRRYQTMILRSGTAKPHYDNGAFDLAVEIAATVLSQVAWNVYLNNPGGGELVMYRRLGTIPGLTKAEAARRGLSWFGNYNVPTEWLDGVQKVVIPVGVGDMVVVPNRYIHAVETVAPGCNPKDRVALSAHIIQTPAGYFDFN